MTQAEFNAMLQTAISQGLPGGYISAAWKWEDIERILHSAATPPDRKVPEFETGVTGVTSSYANYYQKAADGLVAVSIHAKPPIAAAAGQWFPVWTIPAGFRPGSIMNGPVTFYRPNTTGSYEVAPNTGMLRVMLYEPVSSTTYFALNLAYFAER